MEVLSDVLRSLRVTGSVYFCDNLEAPWRQEFGDPERASFHMVRRGQCWLAADSRDEALGPGDFVFAGPGVNHALNSNAPDRPVDDAMARTLLLCGYCRFETGTNHPLLKALPSLTVVRSEALLGHTWLKSTLDQLSTEYQSQKPGSGIVVDKLTEILIVELIRVNFGRGPHSGFIGALYDRPVARALALMHAEPERPWTIEALAAQVALSRAAFAKRFRERVGQTMFEYLTQLRMRKAQDLLRGTPAPLYEVARQAGYESDLAFIKAFKRTLGITPTRYRRQFHSGAAQRIPT